MCRSECGASMFLLIGLREKESLGEKTGSLVHDQKRSHMDEEGGNPQGPQASDQTRE